MCQCQQRHVVPVMHLLREMQLHLRHTFLQHFEIQIQVASNSVRIPTQIVCLQVTESNDFIIYQHDSNYLNSQQSKENKQTKGILSTSTFLSIYLSIYLSLFLWLSLYLLLCSHLSLSFPFSISILFCLCCLSMYLSCTRATLRKG